MISTETSEEFNFLEGEDSANKLWADANSFEWKKAKNAEFLRDEKYPYLLCHVGLTAEGKPLSGYRRKEAIASALGFNTEEEIEEKKMHFRVLYNSEDYLCVYGQLLSSAAWGITGDDFIVQPIIPSLKYMQGSVDGMMKDVTFMNSAENAGLSKPSLDMVLCPGVAVATVDVNGTETTIIEGWEELSEDTAGDIVNMLAPMTMAEKLANSIADTYYLTSEVYSESASSLGDELTERSKLWSGMIEKYQQSEECLDVYRNRLAWKMQRANPYSEEDVSLLNVEFDVTGNTDVDMGCMLTLSLAIAAHPNVCSLESRERVKVQNTVVQWLTQSEVEGRTPFFDVGLDGDGQVVAVSDTGCDRDNCYFYDPDSDPDDSLNLRARKIVQYKNFEDNSDYQYGHGTHVAGTIAGKRFDGEGMADGVAPGAKIAFADIGDSEGKLHLPFDSVLLNTGSPRANIHSASWGSEINAYTTQARNFDQYMYDNQEFLILIAAGNSGHGDAPNTVGSPATGKNIIAVGAHHNTDSSKPKHGLGPSYIADFSSRGPTSDGRTKPDIIAPGKAVLSAGALPYVGGECDPTKNPGANGKKDGVLSLQGTSMATPVVSGTAAIIRQYFEQGYYPSGKKNESDIYATPTGALIKAVLMNGAQFLNGVDNGGDGVTEIQPYDNNQNFGRLALQHSIYLPGKTDVQMTAWDKRAVKDQGFDVLPPVTIDTSDGCTYDKLSVTLVWVEPGSSPGCRNCVLNDLDLSVELGGKTYYPNGRDRPDRLNNAERVIISGVKNGDVATIKVHGYNLIQSRQKYSLVATGCFGGVANQNFVDQCSVFVCDESQSVRMATILMAIFIPLGVLCLCGVGMFFYRRKQQESNNYSGGV